MNKVLSDVANYVTDKINCKKLNNITFIGIDNMISNRGGVTVSEYVPEEGQYTAFKKNDILIGNIRPYFKKIWLAEYDGGCSNDVLCIRAKKGVSPLFIYALLSQDAFFNYDTKGAKGSKMPRGDKNHIMAYPVPELSDADNIGELINNIYCKIHNNTAICSSLESMAKLIYDYWFVQFDFPDKNGKPYRSSGGEMEWCEELGQEIPEGWKFGQMSNLVIIHKESFNPSEHGLQTVEHYSIPAFDNGKFPEFEVANTILSNKNTVPVESILFSKLNPQFKRIWDPPCMTELRACSTEFIAYLPIDEITKPFVYFLLNSDLFYRFTVQIATSSTGSRKRLDPDETLKFNTIIPSRAIIKEFCNIIKPVLEKMKQVQIENYHLSHLRNWLQPLLMNGQAKIAD